MSNSGKNQGEGNKDAARQFNKNEKAFVENNKEKIDDLADSAKEALNDDQTAGDLESARKDGASRAKETEPNPRG